MSVQNTPTPHDNFYIDGSFVKSKVVENEEAFAERIAFEVNTLSNNIQNRMAVVLTEIHGEYIGEIWRLQQALQQQRQENENVCANLKRKFTQENDTIAQSLYRQISEEQSKRKRGNFCDSETQTDLLSQYQVEVPSRAVVMHSQFLEPDADPCAVVRTADASAWSSETYDAPPPPPQ